MEGFKKIPKWICKYSNLVKSYEEIYNDETFNDEIELPFLKEYIVDYPSVESLEDFIKIINICNYWQIQKLPLEVFEFGYYNKKEVCDYLMENKLKQISMLYSNIELAFKIASEKWDDDEEDYDKIYKNIKLAITIWNEINKIRKNQIDEKNQIVKEEEWKKIKKCGILMLRTFL